MNRKNGAPAEGDEEFATAVDDDFMLPSADEPEIDEDGDADVTMPTDETEGEDKPEGEDAGESEATDDAGTAGEGEATPEDEDVEVDLDELFAAGDDAQDAIDDATKTLDSIGEEGASKEEVDTLKEQLARMDTANKRLMEQLEKLSADKSELVVKNAELTAFGGDFTDNNVLILSRNLEKARNGDDKAKGKAVAVCKAVIEELTGEDYDLEKVNEEADILSRMESYNNKSKSDVPKGKEEDDFNIVMD